ncbi:MAG: glycoside hydrolase family 16 protein [Kiritimatiellia bacterium]|nr:glycoside hydrolase family 16 protein [Kiritimatiellia bacterium]
MNLRLAVVATFAPLCCLFAEPAIAPKFLVESPAQVSVEKANPAVSVSMLEGGNFEIRFAEGAKHYPGVTVKPKEKFWDLSPWGRVQLKITNIGKTALGLHARVDEYTGAVYKHDSWNTEQSWLKPGQSQTLKVIFGHHYGHKPGYPLNSARVKQILLFTASAPKGGAFRIEELQAAGSTGEKPPVKPKAPSRKPKDGIFFNGPAATNTLVKAKTPWDLSDYWHATLTLRNPGATPAKGRARLLSQGGTSSTVAYDLPPRSTRDIDIPFLPDTPWKGPEQPVLKPHQKGTGGSTFDSRNVNRIQLLPDTKGPVEIIKAAGSQAPMQTPPWLGTRPPVPGDWKQTLDENFDRLDLRRWNIYAPNYWDKRTHFSKDNLIVKDGKAILRYQRKRGWHNDSQGHKAGQTDYACGILSTYGKWTQRYGYFEARMKLPTAPGLWPAFWTMPDRGRDKDPSGKQFWLRTDTKKIAGDTIGGMEFDIMEHLTAWGPHRFNIAFHWNGYGKEHLATGTDYALLGPDPEGYITIGLLWEPGQASIYGNGRLMATWKNARVSDTPAYLILYMVSGGWANNALEDNRLPADFTIDYVRAWQRADLASPTDGPQKNEAHPYSLDN